MSCPFLIEDQNRCKAVISQVIYSQTGKRIEYQSLTPAEADKCQDPELYPKCPDYKRSEKETCPNCGNIYSPKTATQMNIENATIPVCPKCGATQWRR